MIMPTALPGHWIHLRAQIVIDVLPSKSIGLSGRLPWTLWYLNSWDLRCSRFVSSRLPSPHGGRLPGTSARANTGSPRPMGMWSTDPARRFDCRLTHLAHDGPAVFEHACRLGLEGIVSKRLDSPYRSGPSKVWLKSKNPASEAVRREREESGGQDRPTTSN